jgi:hypothetical protein
MKIRTKQFFLSDIYNDAQFLFKEDKLKFIKLFKSFVDLSKLLHFLFMFTIFLINFLIYILFSPIYTS